MKSCSFLLLVMRGLLCQHTHHADLTLRAAGLEISPLSSSNGRGKSETVLLSFFPAPRNSGSTQTITFIIF